MKEAPKSTVIASKKKELYQKSDKLRSAVTTDINKLKIDIERIGRNFLIIGGSLYVAYKISKLFTSSSSEDEEPPRKLAKTKESSVMGTKIKEQIMLFLLALAFKKLKEFVQENIDRDNEKTDS